MLRTDPNNYYSNGEQWSKQDNVFSFKFHCRLRLAIARVRSKTAKV
jgi:hypothetical protein